MYVQYVLYVHITDDMITAGLPPSLLSRDYLRDNSHLVCEETASYLTLWCVNLEVQQVSLCTHAHNYPPYTFLPLILHIYTTEY